jgi:hypothetical protein
MTSSKRVSVLFDDIAKNMLQSFEGWDRQIPHDGEKGGIRERRVSDFLAKHLPSKYGVASGHIIDKRGATSLQEDIVIFDRFNCPVLEIDPYYQVFPCESVYATVEVKSTLDSGEIEKCVEHTAQLRELYRGDLGHIESFVFAYDSYESAENPPPVWASEKFKEKASSETGHGPMPSIVLCLKKQFVLHFGMAEDDYIVDRLESGILLYYFDHLLSRISRVKTSAPPLFTDYGWGDNSIKRYHKGEIVPIHKLRVERVPFTGTKLEAYLHVQKQILEAKMEQEQDQEEEEKEKEE